VSSLDAELAAIVARSLQITGLALLLSTALGIPLGVCLGLGHFSGKRLLQLVVYTGMGLPPVLAGVAVYLLLSRSGPLGALGWLFTPQAMVLAQTVISLPLVAGLTMAAVEAVPAELPKQLRSLGATSWQTRWAVVREAQPGVAVAVAAAFGRIISEVGAALLVGGDIAGHTRVLSTAVVFETRLGHFGLALALGGWLLTLTMLVNILILRLQGRPLSSP
jgi:tungstate transport system permease protein